ncbi:hypothetical protein D915_008595 [Fasciola hepatica]|uniref:Uncharacterized protein n=1 Tax=Fasciola hepatica TaxID=6192 RepID=A0A4E0R027_FASHE|nr:hypothetical protein D915_008595 [Fasciola hepatica]
MHCFATGEHDIDYDTFSSVSTQTEPWSADAVPYTEILQGQILDIVQKPWLFLAVPEIPCFESKSVSDKKQGSYISSHNLTDTETDGMDVPEDESSEDDQDVRPLSPSAVIDALEAHLSPWKGQTMPLAKIRDIMDKLNQKWDRLPDSGKMKTYHANLARLLKQFQLRQDEAQKHTDAKSVRYYTRLVKLIRNELDRCWSYGEPRKEKKNGYVRGNAKSEYGMVHSISNGNSRHFDDLEVDFSNQESPVSVKSRGTPVHKSATLPFDDRLKPAMNGNERVISISARPGVQTGTTTRRRYLTKSGKEELIIYA